MTETLVIRGGTIVDGTGAARYESDVAIVGERSQRSGARCPRATGKSMPAES